MSFTIPSDVSQDDFTTVPWANAIKDAISEHVHDGADGTTAIDLGDTTGTLTASQIPDASISQGKLEVSTNTQGTTNADLGGSPSYTHLTISSQSYCFLPTWDCDMISGGSKIVYFGDTLGNASFPSSSAPLIRFKIEESSAWPAAGSLVMRTKYVTASPPWPLIGAEDWGLFLFVVRDKTTGRAVRFSACEDAPWMGLLPYLPKGHPARIAMRPTPFDLYQCKPEHEIVLVDLRHMQGVVEVDDHMEAHARQLAQNAALLVERGVRPEDIEAAEREMRSAVKKVRVRKLDAALRVADIADYVMRHHRLPALDDPMSSDAALLAELCDSIAATHELRAAERASIPSPLTRAGVRILRTPSRAL